MRDLVGEVLSHRYRIVARIAGGGMGEVYRGHDLLLDRSVAVKVLQPSLATDPDLVARFRAEARAAARLSHPNIVAVHDWGAEDDHTYYMVMEYVSGSDLRDLLVSRGSLDPAHAAGIMASVCEALSVAHAHGLIHRDVKPENILLARDGTVKVADFGIAAMVDADRTMPGGTIHGTLRYVAPEQARGEDAGPQADIWAAGAVLAELVTGSPPGRGSGADVLRHRANEQVEAPSKMDPSIPRAIDDIVATACALDPADRYQNAAEMARDLRSLTDTDVEAGPGVEMLLDHVTGEIRLPDMEPTTFVSNRSLKRAGRRAPRARFVAIAILVLLVAAGAAKGATWLFGARDVAVPSLRGLAKGAATRRADDRGLDITVVDRERSPTVPKGHVISQSPKSGQIQEGSKIEVVLSSGYPLFEIPDVTGLTKDLAAIRLHIRKFEIGDVTYEYSMKPEGTVISQSPADGKREWFTKVGLVVSKGPEPVAVPDVVGKSRGAALDALRSEGFVPVPVDAYSDDVPEGKVVSTDPATGEVIGRGSEIRVYISVGPRFAEVTMPDVRGMGVDEAKAKLTALGLRVHVVQSCPGSIVVETQPIAGTKLHEHDTVALFVC
ncbi:MAG TPA: Stk1 family PASTA domain-containing Ser/Thr kinase [Actinomycetota bacterium]|nr:Stk1 family PASTA domain-containing Ser/Thr kinase [Actinomycetota bacterium]